MHAETAEVAGGLVGCKVVRLTRAEPEDCYALGRLEAGGVNDGLRTGEDVGQQEPAEF